MSSKVVERCDAELPDRAKMRTMPKGKLAWKWCRRAATVTKRGGSGTFLSYCNRHAEAPGHGLGINDLKVIEARNLLRAIADGAPARPGFDVGLRVQRVMEAMERSHASGAWTDV